MGDVGSKTTYLIRIQNSGARSQNKQIKHRGHRETQVQITNSKLQITNNFQIQMAKALNLQ